MMFKLKLSKRLRAIASCLHKSTIFADIGSDHAYLPCFVCLQDQNTFAIAGEVAEGPYLRAKETVESFQLCERIDVRLGNGLEVITPQDDIREIVIAGMGGSLISQIARSGIDQLTTVDRLILQPNNHADLVRSFLMENELSLVNEIILEENNFFYEILVAETNNSQTSYQSSLNLNKQLLFGPILMKEKSPVFIKKWTREQQKLQNIINEMNNAKEKDKDKLKLFKTQLKWMEEILS